LPTLLFEFVSPMLWLGGLALTIVAWAFGLLSTLYFIAFLVVSLGQRRPLDRGRRGRRAQLPDL
jgi:hypothetical protein